MASGRITPRDALLARADRAIADARATRVQVRAGLAAAGRVVPGRPVPGGPWRGAGDASAPVPDGRGDPPWSVADALATARAALRAADAELGRPWHRAAPAAPAPPE